MVMLMVRFRLYSREPLPLDRQQAQVRAARQQPLLVIIVPGMVQPVHRAVQDFDAS